MTAHALTTTLLFSLAIVGIVVWIQNALDARSKPTDTQRFDDVARHLRPRKPAARGKG